MTAQDPSPRSIAVQAFTRTVGGRLVVRLRIVGETHAAAGGSITLSLVSLRDRRTYRTAVLAPLGDLPTPETAFDMGPDIPWGCCALKAEVADRTGAPFLTDLLHDSLTGDFPWLGSFSEVETGAVPDPWTPLEVSGDETPRIRCWGREYAFGGACRARDGAILLSSASSLGESLLSRPIRLAAAADGARIVWSRTKVSVDSRGPDRVVLRGESTADGGLRIRSRFEIDFDGVVRVDFSLAADRSMTLESLDLQAAVPGRAAKYLYTYPGRWGGARNAGTIPGEPVRMGFVPYVWLGDEERGISWFSDSDRNWIPSGRRDAVRIDREDDAVVLTLRLLDAPVTLAPAGEDGAGSPLTGLGVEAVQAPPWNPPSGLRYAFGFQATPVKPVDRDAWDRRIFCIGQRTPGFRPRFSVEPSLLDALCAAGVRTVVLFEHWADAEGYVRTPHEEAVRAVVRGCHERGLAVLLYFSFLVSDAADEWESWGKGCLVLPKGGYPVYSYSPQPVQSAWRVCLNSPWQDLLVEGIGRMLDASGADGVYLDGTELPMACANTEHGCGRIGVDGSVAPTYPIWGVRGAMRRIRTAVLRRRPDGQVNVHNSTCMTMPTLGWATGSWDGEQFQGAARGGDPGALLPLDAFRAEFMGRQWGVAAEFLHAGEAWSYRQAWGMALLHDVPVRATDPGGELALQSRIWKAMDDFGRRGARWVPYWADGGLVEASAGVLVSLYVRPGGVLAVAANTGRDAVETVLRFAAASLGNPGGAWSVADALDGSVPQRAGDGILLPLPGFDWRLLVLHPQGGAASGQGAS